MQPTLESSTHLDSAVAALNKNRDSEWSTAASTPSDKFDVQSVLTHEMGHAAGLDHQGSRPCIMYGYFVKGEQRRTPCSAEAQDLVNVYNSPH